jgi:hypothetical protein
MKTPMQRLIEQRGGDKVYPEPGTIDHLPIKAGACGEMPSKLPCVECPLARASIPGRLGGYTVQQYLHILHHIADIACHMSPGFPDDMATQRSCTGVAMYRANAGVIPSGHAYEAVRAVAGGDCTAAFANPREFALHHTPKPED